MVVKEIDVNRKLSEEELRMLEEAERMPIVYDEDSPELSDDELSQFKRISEVRKEDRR